MKLPTRRQARLLQQQRCSIPGSFLLSWVGWVRVGWIGLGCGFVFAIDWFRETRDAVTWYLLPTNVFFQRWLFAEDRLESPKPVLSAQTIPPRSHQPGLRNPFESAVPLWGKNHLILVFICAQPGGARFLKEFTW